MKVVVQRAALELDRNQLVKLRGARGVRLACRKGRLWVTQEGIARDDFLDEGQSLMLETDGTVVIEAVWAAGVTIEPARAPARAGARRVAHAA